MSKASLKFFLNNQQVEAPDNWQGINITLDFNNDGEGPFRVQPEISTDNLKFVLESSGIIRQWIEDGVNGSGPGIYEPMELRIELSSAGSNVVVFDGLLDMVNDMQLVDKNETMVKLIKKGGTNQLSQRAQGISFAYLESIGEITSSDYVKIKYVLAHVPNFSEVMIISISIFILIKEITESIRRIAELVTDILAAVAGGFTGTIAGIIMLVGRTISELLYTILILFALQRLMIELIKNLVAPEREHVGMKLLTLLQKGATHLGYTFESSEFNSPFFAQLMILPIKERAPLPAPLSVLETGFPTNKGGLYTYFQMLEFYQTLINGKTVVKDDKIIIERRDFFDNPSGFILPDIFLDEFRYNAEEIQSNLNIEFLIDEKDDTTLENYVANGTTFQRITEPKIINNKQNVQLKGLESVNLPVSLPTRKTTLTSVEKLLLDLAKLVDLFVGGNLFSSLITGRIGALHLANDFTGVPKIIPLSVGRVRPNPQNTISSKILHDDYYFINSFTPDPTNHNQVRRHVGLDIPFCFEDYVLLSDNNGFITDKGEEGVFEKIEGNPDDGSAVVDVRIKDVFTNNLRDRIV